MTREKYKKAISKNIVLKLLLLILIITIIISSYFMINRYKNHEENEALKSFMVDNNVIENTIIEGPEETNIPKTDRMIKLEALQLENSDIVGWLEISGSNISYPVLQGTDNDFYMTHNYKKEYSSEGSLFLDKDYNWEIPSTNLLIYGHNNRGTNEMFCQLLNYKDESYYKDHKKIRFTTVKEDAEYEIISVFLSRVYYKNEKDVFRYYYFINSNNEDEFNYYIENSKKESLYDTGVSAEYGDQLLTLSTCEFSRQDGRLAVVAKKIKNN